MIALPAPGSLRRPSAPSRTPATLHMRAASPSAPQTRHPSSSVGPFFLLSRRAPACSLLLFPGEDRVDPPLSLVNNGGPTEKGNVLRELQQDRARPRNLLRTSVCFSPSVGFRCSLAIKPYSPRQPWDTSRFLFVRESQQSSFLEFGRMEISCIKKSYAPFPAKISKFKGQSVRALPLRILTVGKKRSPGIQLIVEEYNEKIRHYCNLEDIHIKSNPRNTSNVKAQIEAEDMIMMQHIKPEDWVVVLDEHGADICSEQMADLVGDAGRTVVSKYSLNHKALPVTKEISS